MAESLDPYFTVFGLAATLAGQSARVIFEAPAREADGLVSDLPACRLPTASVPSPVVGQRLVVPLGDWFGNYTVRQHLPDGTGVSTLVLAREA